MVYVETDRLRTQSLDDLARILDVKLDNDSDDETGSSPYAEQQLFVVVNKETLGSTRGLEHLLAKSGRPSSAIFFFFIFFFWAPWERGTRRQDARRQGSHSEQGDKQMSTSYAIEDSTSYGFWEVGLSQSCSLEQSVSVATRSSMIPTGATPVAAEFSVDIILHRGGV